jgi:NTE family protein
MRISAPQDVRFLALEGGGGKGITYLGAIRALEQMGVLPIDINRPGQNQIQGISGASAGAITALLLAMGLDSAELARILSRPATFTAFFDGPLIGSYRSVDRHNRPEWHNDVPPGIAPMNFIRSRVRQISGWSTLVSLVAMLARTGAFGSTSDPIVQRLISQPEGYLYNLVFDRGLFPGFAPRNFLSAMISGYMSNKILQYTGGLIVSSPNGGDLNFDLFFRMTGVDLVITGTNVTKSRPSVFSRRHTPNFPVAEAVGISMNLPFLFKPVLVEADVPVGPLNRSADDYHGFWVDGGVLNNFPLHAFDHLQTPPSRRFPNLLPLHPNVLGLRLTDGYPPGSPARSGPSAAPGTFDVLLTHLGNTANTVLYPSEQGQIRTPDEADQSIDLYTYDLSTTEFAPPPAKQATPVRQAEQAVNTYFGVTGRP